jgi:hypothetical protein
LVGLVNSSGHHLHHNDVPAAHPTTTIPPLTLVERVTTNTTTTTTAPLEVNHPCGRGRGSSVRTPGHLRRVGSFGCGDYLFLFCSLFLFHSLLPRRRSNCLSLYYCNIIIIISLLHSHCQIQQEPRARRRRHLQNRERRGFMLARQNICLFRTSNE